MPQTAESLGTTTDQLARMSAVKQLDFVEQYFLPRQGKLAGYEVTRRFYEIGSAEGLRETDALLRGAS